MDLRRGSRHSRHYGILLTASAVPSLEGLRKSCGLTSASGGVCLLAESEEVLWTYVRQWRGMPAGGVSINQKSPIINSNFSKISGFPPQAGGESFPAPRNLEILGKSIIIDEIVISPRFLDFRRRRGVNLSPLREIWKS